MDICWTFTGDGLLAFAGGALALLGVWWSNHQSVKNLQKQLEAEREARRDEQEVNKRALASALLFEIDHIYRTFLDRALRIARGVKGKDVRTDMAFAVGGTAALEVYQGNTGSLGALGFETTVAVIRFYKVAWDVIDLWQRYAECLDRGDPGDFSQNITNAMEAMSRGLRIGALEACSWLCISAGLSFESTDLGVVKDRAEIMQLANSIGLSVSLPASAGQAPR